jgi:DNA-binding FrmR family transcriptional regulator
MDKTEELKKRINRIVGQLHGIEKMVQGERECTEVLQQLTAIKKAVDGLSKEILVSDICKYVPEKDSKKIEQMVQRAIDM